MSPKKLPSIVNILSNLVPNVEALLKKLGKIIRWDFPDMFPEKSMKQSTLRHSSLIVILATEFLLIERRNGNPHGLNSLNILGHANIHDFCEAEKGDVSYAVKEDSGKPELFKKEEEDANMRALLNLEMFQLLAGNCGILSGIDEEFFDAIEKLEYLLCAMAEYQKYGHKSFVQVFARNLHVWIAYAEKFVSFRHFYTEEVHAWVMKQIKKHPKYMRQFKDTLDPIFETATT